MRLWRSLGLRDSRDKRDYCICGVWAGYSFAVSLTGSAWRWTCADTEAARADISDSRVFTTFASYLSRLILVAYCSFPAHIALDSISFRRTIG